MAKSKKRINIALQGGGAHGALAWGILDKILEDGRLDFDSISATSAGAMNAAALVHGLASGGKEGAREALYNFWKKISDSGQKYNPLRLTPWEELWGVPLENSFSYFCFDMMSKAFSPYQLNPFNFNPLRMVLEESIDIELIRAQRSPKLFITATNVKTGKIKIFDNQELSLDAILASACLPFLFQTVQVDEEYYWDGGYLGNPAIYPLIYNAQSRDVLIIHINPIYREQIPHTPDEILNRLNEISFNSSLMREMRAISFVTKLLDDGWIKEEYRSNMKRLYLHAIRADVSMQEFSVASKLNPDWSFLQTLYKQGRSEAEQWLDDHFTHINKKTTIDINEYL